MSYLPPSKRRLPPLNALRAFEAAVRNGSFTRAARELLVTQSAVSRHVSGLEKWLGLRLVDRTRRGIEATPRGSDLFVALTNVFEQIERVAHQLRRASDERVLRLKLPPTFAIRWLVPRLARFHALNSSIDVQVTTTSHRPIDWNQDDFDVCIHSEADLHPANRRLPLFGEVLLPVCSPGLLERHAELQQPADLCAHALVSLNRPDDWSTWLSAAGVSDFDLKKALTFESSALAYQAALDELGVAMAQRAFVEDDLRTGRLVAPFSLRVPTANCYYLTHSAAQQPSEMAEAFERWIVGETMAMDERVK